MMASNEYCLAAVGNLRKARKIWSHMSIILVNEGVNPRVPGMFFKTLMQTVLIFWAEMWAMTPRVVRALGVFQHRVARRITGRHPRRLLDGVWEYPPLDMAIQEAGFE